MDRYIDICYEEPFKYLYPELHAELKRRKEKYENDFKAHINSLSYDELRDMWLNRAALSDSFTRDTLYNRMRELIRKSKTNISEPTSVTTTTV